jgi:DNA-binding CsgD family transcriptional regulator
VWPFEGRETELALIRSMFDESRTGAVILTAPAGTGKTRLARQALLGLTGARREWIAATRAAAAIPFGAVSSLLPEAAGRGAQVEFMRAAARHIHGWGGRHRVAVVVDDAHLLDDASSTLIAHLISTGAAFVILTTRTGEPCADVLIRLCADGHARRVELPPLPEAVIDRLIDHAAVARLDPRRRRRLRQTARGNPLALRELLFGAQPGGLTELVTARLSALSSPTRQVVELVACGEPLSLTALEKLAGLAAVEAAEESGLIVVEHSGGRVNARLDHPLYGEVLRSSMSRARATLVHRALANALLDTGLRRREDVLRAALWQVEGGAISRPDVVRAGAWQAIGFAGLELAERLARSARAAEPGAEVDRLLAEILAYRGRSGEAERVLPPTPPPALAERVQWAVTRAETLYWGDGNIDRALAALDAAELHELAEASRSWLLFFHARCLDAVRVASSVLENPAVEPKSAIWATAAGCAANGFLGRLDEAVAVHRRGAVVAAAHAQELPWGMFEVDAGACLAQLACGQPSAAESIAATGYENALGEGPPMMASGWALYYGLAAAARGHLDRASRLLGEAADGFATNDTFRLARCCLAARAGVAAFSSDVRAPVFLARADALAHDSNRILLPWIELWRAWTAYAGGDLPAAVAAATHAVDLAHDANMDPVEALALYELARLGARTDLTRLGAIPHGFARLLAAAARALAAPDGASALEQAARSFRARGYDLYAAEAYTVAAHHHQRQGRLARSNLALAEATTLRAAFPEARTALLQSDRLISDLTPREREVLLLAARHTSAQIADRLQLAVPTVNNNLARAYAKLGIHGRAQLRILLRDAPVTVRSANGNRGGR